jgi:hypothetical protein
MARQPRPPKSGRYGPATAEAAIAKSQSQKRLWQDPEYRSKMIAARQRSAEDRRRNPHKYSRLGIPNGWTKEQAMDALNQANELADNLIKKFEQQGIVSEDGQIIPDSDEEIAKACLREAVILALAPGDKRTRLMALNTVLKYTKAQPTQRHEATLATSSTEWLQSALVASERIKQSPAMNNGQSHND